MGVAAYNRGTALVRHQITVDNPIRPAEFELLDRLDALPRGSSMLFEATVARWDNDRKGWWLMNRADDGWAEFGYWMGALRNVVLSFNVRVTGFGVDKHSRYAVVTPTERDI